MRIIWTEGLLGMGKTWFSSVMAKLLKLHMIPEPVQANFYLSEFYKDPKKYAFGMQIFLLHYRLFSKQIGGYMDAREAVQHVVGKIQADGHFPDIQVPADKQGVIIDRCIAGDKAFANLHYEAGNIDPLDYACYEFCYRGMAHTIAPPTLMIYLKGQPTTAYRRMQQRARDAEAGVPLDYLRSLYAEYEKLMLDFRLGRTPWGRVDVRTVMWDKDISSPQEWVDLAQSVADDAGMKGPYQLGTDKLAHELDYDAIKEEVLV